MLNTNFLMLSLGPVETLVRIDRESKGISNAQLKRAWAIRRTSPTVAPNGRRSRDRAVVDGLPTIRVECK